jgi:hypothetical protein
MICKKRSSEGGPRPRKDLQSDRVLFHALQPEGRDEADYENAAARENQLELDYYTLRL